MSLGASSIQCVNTFSDSDFLGCTASEELHLSLCVLQGIRRNLCAGFAYLKVYPGDQDRQVHNVPSYGEEGTLWDLGVLCPPCPNTQGTWQSPTHANTLCTPTALVTPSNSMDSANVVAERDQPALSSSWPLDGCIGAISQGHVQNSAVNPSQAAPRHSPAPPASPLALRRCSFLNSHIPLRVFMAFLSPHCPRLKSTLLREPQDHGLLEPCLLWAAPSRCIALFTGKAALPCFSLGSTSY